MLGLAGSRQRPKIRFRQRKPNSGCALSGYAALTRRKNVAIKNQGINALIKLPLAKGSSLPGKNLIDVQRKKLLKGC